MNNSIRLIDIYDPEIHASAVDFLYQLLGERDPEINISHRGMPTLDQHRQFVESRPYQAWYVIVTDIRPVGSVYITPKNEIGIFIQKNHQGKGYGKRAIRALMELHPAKEFLANIAPRNSKSMAMFEGIGFELVQLTFKKENI